MVGSKSTWTSLCCVLGQGGPDQLFFQAARRGASAYRAKMRSPTHSKQSAACSISQVGRRMWIIFDFRDKLKRLEHGTTYDSSVLLGP